MVGLSVIAHDITERRAEQRALEASQHGLAEAQRIAHLGSFEFDVVTGELTWSEEYYRILGSTRRCRRASLCSSPMVHPDDLPAVTVRGLTSPSGASPSTSSSASSAPTSDERFVRARGVAEAAEDGTVVKVAGTMMDDTERVEADRVRRAAETRFEIGFEQAGDRCRHRRSRRASRYG